MSGLVNDVPAELAQHLAAILKQRDAAPDGAEVRTAPSPGGTEPNRAAVTWPGPDALAEAGLAALRRALASDDPRAVAADLLAADALITEACADAAARGIPEALSAERFAALLEVR